MAISDTDFSYLCNLVRNRAAILLGEEKSYLAECRLQTLTRREGYASLDELFIRLRAGTVAGLDRKVVEAMTTNETFFFRDIYPFEALRKVILPNLIKERETARRLRIWCAACSTGQEPYSMAMLIREYFPQVLGWDFQLLATDFSLEVLAKAREGNYSLLEVNRGLPAPLLVKYFHRNGAEWQIRDDVRRMVDFQQLNLAASWPGLPAQDIVLLRNVLIYFDIPTKKDILGRVRRVLSADGHLFLGGAESTLNLDDGYDRLGVERTSVYRHRIR